MKKSFLALLMALVLMFTVLMPAAGAGGFRDKLNSLKEKVGTVITGDGKTAERVQSVETFVRKLISKVEAKCREEGIEPEKAIEQLMGMITDKDGNIDLSTLISLLGMYTGKGTEFEDETEETEPEPGSYIWVLRMRDKAVLAYLTEEYQDMIEPGDVTISSDATVSNDEDDLRYAFGYFSLYVYTPDGSDLKFKGYAGNVEYLVFDMDDEYNFTLIEATPAEDGEGYNASVDAMCERHGVPRNGINFNTDEAHREWNETLNLVSYLKNHPEYERIEYNGEMKTLDEMTAINDTALDSMLEAWDKYYGDI